jgi:putative ATPase
METTIGETTVRVIEGDLTAMEVDAVVNAANEHLVHGGGLAAAIVRTGGEVIQDESDRWVAEHGPLTPGAAAVTGAGDLPCRSVIHVAGPRYRKHQDNEGLLRAAVEAALTTAAERGFRSVALPAISAGIFGYPLGQATRVIAGAAAAWITAHHGALDEVDLVGFDRKVTAAFADGLRNAVETG